MIRISLLLVGVVLQAVSANAKATEASMSFMGISMPDK